MIKGAYICLNNKYSTTRMVTEKPPVLANEGNSQFDSLLFLAASEKSRAVGGMRTRCYFKQKYPDCPLISIITVVYNGEPYLEHTIQSVLSQTYSNVEYIIIDGGSIDGTMDIIRKYDGEIDCWVSEGDNGIYDAMNKGIKLSTGQIIGIVNSDDWYEPDALSQVANSYCLEPFAVCYGILRRHYPSGRTQTVDVITPTSKDTMRLHAVHPTVFVSRNAYDLAGIFNINYKMAADYDMLLRVYDIAPSIVKIQKVLTNMRSGGASSASRGKYELIKIAYKNELSMMIVLLNTYKYLKYIVRMTLERAFPVAMEKYFSRKYPS